VISASRYTAVSSIKLTPVIDSLLEASNKRFGLITVTRGFTRGKGNFSSQIAKGVLIGIVTLGMYYQVPIKANSTLFAMIVDAKDNNVAFFKELSGQDKEPLNKTVLEKQINELFEGYFWTKL
jgi:hypothetical protein